MQAHKYLFYKYRFYKPLQEITLNKPDKHIFHCFKLYNNTIRNVITRNPKIEVSKFSNR